MAISTKTVAISRKVFGWIGLLLSKHPILVLIIGLCITIVSGLGLLNATFISNPDQLYMSQNTDIKTHYDTKIKYFGGYPDKLELLLVSNNNSNLVTSHYLDMYHNIADKIYDINITYNDKYYNYQTICYKSFGDDECLDITLTNIFFNNHESQWHNQFVLDSFFKESDSLTSFVGDIHYDNHIYKDLATGGSMLLIPYLLTPDDILSDELVTVKQLFEDKFAEIWIEDSNVYDDFNVYFYSTNFLEEEIISVIIQDVPIFIISFIIMFVYLGIINFSFSNWKTKSKSLLSFASLLTLICTLIMGFGLCSIFWSMNSMIFLIPFLILGIGVDDDIIIIDTLNETKTSKNRFIDSFQTSGLTISITSLCTMMAFASVTFLATFILQFLIFSPLVVFDDMRSKNNRNCCVPCITYEDNQEDEDKDVKVKEKEDKNGLSSLPVCIINFIAYLFNTEMFRVLSILIGLFLPSLSIIWVSEIPIFTDHQQFLPDDSPLHKYAESIKYGYSSSVPFQFELIIENEDFSKYQTLQKIYSMFNDFESTDWIINGINDNWLNDFAVYLQTNFNINILDKNTDNTISSQQFYLYLSQFTNTTEYAKYKELIIYDSLASPSFIKITQFKIDWFADAKINENWGIYQHAQKIINNHGINGFCVWQYTYLIYLERIYLESSIYNMIYSLCGILIVLLFFFNFRFIVFTMFVLIMIDINIFGWVYVFDLNMDLILFIILIMTVGITVDYIIHITNGFIEMERSMQHHDPNSNPTLKIQYLFSHIGKSVFKGAFSTFLGSLMLAFSNSIAFRTFFYVFSGVTLIATLYGLIFVPAFLIQFKYLFSALYKPVKPQNKTQDSEETKHTICNGCRRPDKPLP